jgi:hypothetical protein
MRDLDINLHTLNTALKYGTVRLQRAKRDLREANASGVKTWRAAAFRQLNHARTELRRLTKLARAVL